MKLRFDHHPISVILEKPANKAKNSYLEVSWSNLLGSLNAFS